MHNDDDLIAKDIDKYLKNYLGLPKVLNWLIATYAEHIFQRQYMYSYRHKGRRRPRGPSELNVSKRQQRILQILFDEHQWGQNHDCYYKIFHWTDFESIDCVAGRYYHYSLNDIKKDLLDLEKMKYLQSRKVCF